jgi:hypothetical protein
MAVAKVVTTLLMERFKLCKTDERPRKSFSFSRISKQKKEAYHSDIAKNSEKFVVSTLERDSRPLLYPLNYSKQVLSHRENISCT